MGDAATETFSTTVELGGRSATGLPVPDDVVDALGGGKRPAVIVSIGDYTYRSTIGRMGGVFLIPLSAEHRSASGLAAGDVVEVGLALDTAPRVVDVPPELAAELHRNPPAAAAWAALSYSHQRQHALAIEGAKTDETRQRRVAKAVEQLLAG